MKEMVQILQNSGNKNYIFVMIQNFQISAWLFEVIKHLN